MTMYRSKSTMTSIELVAIYIYEFFGGHGEDREEVC
jgi:hypothetical protein